jgi:hypothetical protein
LDIIFGSYHIHVSRKEFDKVKSSTPLVKG